MDCKIISIWPLCKFLSDLNNEWDSFGIFSCFLNFSRGSYFSFLSLKVFFNITWLNMSINRVGLNIISEISRPTEFFKRSHAVWSASCFMFYSWKQKTQRLCRLRKFVWRWIWNIKQWTMKEFEIFIKFHLVFVLYSK